MDQRISDSSSNCTRHSHGLDDNGIVNSNIGGHSIQQLLRSSGSHQEILESHANSTTNALIYISVVLLMYILAMAFIVIRYVLMKSSHSPPYYFGSSKNKATTTTATTTFGASGNTNMQGPSTCIDAEEETPPEIRFIETEL